MPSSVALSKLNLLLIRWNDRLEVMDNVCRLCNVIRGGQLLNELILIQENESNEQKRVFNEWSERSGVTHSEILRVATAEYFAMMQKYIYYGVVDDYYEVRGAGLCGL